MKIKVRDAGKVNILDVEGNLRVENDGLLRKAVTGLLDEGKTMLVLNLKKAKWADSSGIGQMIACRELARKKGGDLKVAEPSKVMYTILGRFPHNFEIFEQEVQAVGAF